MCRFDAKTFQPQLETQVFTVKQFQEMQVSAGHDLFTKNAKKQTQDNWDFVRVFSFTAQQFLKYCWEKMEWEGTSRRELLVKKKKKLDATGCTSVCKLVPCFVWKTKCGVCELMQQMSGQLGEELLLLVTCLSQSVTALKSIPTFSQFRTAAQHNTTCMHWWVKSKKKENAPMPAISSM